MPLAPQEIRTYFVTSIAFERRKLLQGSRTALLLIDVFRTNVEKQRIQAHEFVVMPDHFHAMLTPAPDVSLEKAVQYIKGGYSFRAKKELGYSFEVWQAGYTEKRMVDAADYRHHAIYVRENPVRARLVTRSEDWEYSSARAWDWISPAPPHLQG
jgi:putative transposase